MNKRRNEAVVGMFVLLGFLLLTLLVFFVSGVYFFRSGFSVDVLYNYVSILDRGAPVRMAGVRVGEVSSVTLLPPEDGQAARVRVRLFIEEGVEVRQNYSFKVQGTHILSEPHIEITPAAGMAPVVAEGTVIEGVNPVPLENLIDQAHGIAGQLSSILQSVGQFTGDPETGEEVKQMIHHLAQVSASLNQLLGNSGDNMKSSLENLNESTDDLRIILDRLEAGEGTLGRLTKDDALYEDMRAFVAEIKARPWRLLKKDNEGGKKFLFF